MAKQSKAKAYTGQLKRKLSLAERALSAMAQANGRATALVLGMLVQAGGDITFSEATTATMNKDLARMGYKILPDPDGLVKIVLVMQDAEGIATDGLAVDEEVPRGKIVLTD